MERLTERTHRGTAHIKGTVANYSRISYECQIPEGLELLKKALEKLARYEDAEENGLLVRLPCKVGDCLYSIALGRVTKHKIYGCRYNGNDVFLLWVPGEFRVDGIPAKSIGKTVFLTQAEAEAKLKEMEGEDADSD